jgi:hypothetical protein
MIFPRIVMLIAGFLLKVSILWTIGIIVLRVRVVLAVMGVAGRANGRPTPLLLTTNPPLLRSVSDEGRLRFPEAPLKARQMSEPCSWMTDWRQVIAEVVVALIIPISVAVSESPQAAARNV